VRRFSPFHLGIVEWLALVTLLATCLATVFQHEAYPSSELMRSIAEVGATLFVAWIVQATWMSTQSERHGDDRENWLGGTAGLGIAGLVGIAISLLVAAHREAGHGSFLDWLGIWWGTVSLSALGFLVALYPVIAARWLSQSPRD
jgi:hypothetical protein